MAKRQAIRETWGRLAGAVTPGVIRVVFVLAQPPSGSGAVATAVQLLAAEVAQHQDIVVVPGKVR